MDLSLIFSYGVQMTLVVLIGLALWTLKVKMSPVDTRAWYRANGQSVFIALCLCWMISAALVVVPNFAQVLGGFGFNADASTTGIALVVVGFLVGGATEPHVQENI
jgi:hypothetical protein